MRTLVIFPLIALAVVGASAAASQSGQGRQLVDIARRLSLKPPKCHKHGTKSKCQNDSRCKYMTAYVKRCLPLDAHECEGITNKKMLIKCHVKFGEPDTHDDSEEDDGDSDPCFGLAGKALKKCRKKNPETHDDSEEDGDSDDDSSEDQDQDDSSSSSSGSDDDDDDSSEDQDDSSSSSSGSDDDDDDEDHSSSASEDGHSSEDEEVVKPPKCHKHGTKNKCQSDSRCKYMNAYVKRCLPLDAHECEGITNRKMLIKCHVKFGEPDTHDDSEEDDGDSDDDSSSDEEDDGHSDDSSSSSDEEEEEMSAANLSALTEAVSTYGHYPADAIGEEGISSWDQFCEFEIPNASACHVCLESAPPACAARCNSFNCDTPFEPDWNDHPAQITTWHAWCEWEWISSQDSHTPTCEEYGCADHDPHEQLCMYKCWQECADYDDSSSSSSSDSDDDDDDDQLSAADIDALAAAVSTFGPFPAAAVDEEGISTWEDFCELEIPSSALCDVCEESAPPACAARCASLGCETPFEPDWNDDPEVITSWHEWCEWEWLNQDDDEHPCVEYGCVDEDPPAEVCAYKCWQHCHEFEEEGDDDDSDDDSDDGHGGDPFNGFPGADDMTFGGFLELICSAPDGVMESFVDSDFGAGASALPLGQLFNEDPTHELQAENDRLRARIAELEAQLGD